MRGDLPRLRRKISLRYGAYQFVPLKDKEKTLGLLLIRKSTEAGNLVDIELSRLGDLLALGWRKGIQDVNLVERRGAEGLFL